MTSMVRVALEDVPSQTFVDRPRTDDEQVVVRGQPVGDVHNESLEVLETVRLAGSLWAATATVANARIVPDVAGGPVTSRYLRLDPYESSPVVVPADDDGLPRVDPHEGAGSRHTVTHRRVIAQGTTRRDLLPSVIDAISDVPSVDAISGRSIR